MIIPEPQEPIYNLMLPFLAKWDRLPFAAVVESCAAHVQTTDSCYLLYSLLKLTEPHTDKLCGDLVNTYLLILAKLSPCIWRLSRKNTGHLSFASEDDENYEADNDEDSDDEAAEMEIDMPAGELSGTGSRLERCVLREIVSLLNDPKRTDQIMGAVDHNLDNLMFLNHLCHVCHVLMVQNRSAMYEYRLVYLLTSKTQFIRSVWHVMTTLNSQGTFTSPLTLISKGIFVRKWSHSKIK